MIPIKGSAGSHELDAEKPGINADSSNHFGQRISYD
jgi:hypothetical protein